jgi:hypothetical protein
MHDGSLAMNSAPQKVGVEQDILLLRRYVLKNSMPPISMFDKKYAFPQHLLQ